MKLENQVCSLEPAKRLKELGVKQESLYFYSKPCAKHVYSVFRQVQSYSLARHGDAPPISAFTATELGEMLPHYIDGEPLKIWHELGNKSWDIAYNTRPATNHKLEIWFQDDTEADARAKMLIYLLENKLMTQLPR